MINEQEQEESREQQELREQRELKEKQELKEKRKLIQKIYRRKYYIENKEKISKYFNSYNLLLNTE